MADEQEDGPRAGDLVFGFRSDTKIPWPAFGTASRVWREDDGEYYAELED